MLCAKNEPYAAPPSTQSGGGSGKGSNKNVNTKNGTSWLGQAPTKGNSLAGYAGRQLVQSKARRLDYLVKYMSNTSLPSLFQEDSYIWLEYKRQHNYHIKESKSDCR